MIPTSKKFAHTRILSSTSGTENWQAIVTWTVDRITWTRALWHNREAVWHTFTRYYGKAAIYNDDAGDTIYVWEKHAWTIIGSIYASWQQGHGII